MPIVVQAQFPPPPFPPSNTVVIAVAARPPMGGTVSGGGVKTNGVSVTVAATANSGYTFADWTENGTVASTSSSYTFTATSNRTLDYLMRTMTKSLPEGWITSLNIPGRVLKTVAEHGNILAAIERRDPDEAERAMTLHLSNARDDIRASLEL